MGKAASCLLLLALSVCISAEGAKKKPNIVLVLVDDQDATLNSTHPRYMPNLNKWIVDKGVTFSNYFVNTPVCCPSRATLLTGRHSHNSNFTDVIPPYGGYTYWQEANLDSFGTLPQWMQQQGYNTYYTGKLFVEYTPLNCNPPPAGYNDIDALTLPHVFDYYNPAFSRNGAAPVTYPGKYTTDVVASKALAQLKKGAHYAKTEGKPFFLQVAPVAPHDAVTFDMASMTPHMHPPVPAARHAALYANVNMPRYENFNETDAGKPAFLRALPPLTLANVTYMNHYYRQRLRSLAAVDEMVGALITELEQQGILGDTYFIYTGDNGYHIGMYRQGAGKETPYEEDIKVPFFIRGPGLKQAVVNSGYGSHVDLAATLVSLAGGTVPHTSDGQPLPLADSAEEGTKLPQPEARYDSTPLEFWGENLDQLTGVTIHNYSWKAVRGDFGKIMLFKYTVWCTGEHELYDLHHDPLALNNLLAPGVTSPNYSRADIKRFADRLDALLSAWYTCAGYKQCVSPIRRVLPEAKTLADTLDPKYDRFFAQLTKFGYKECLGYFLPSNEFGPFDAELKPASFPNNHTNMSHMFGADATEDIQRLLKRLGNNLHQRRLLSTTSDADRSDVAPVEAFAVPVAARTLLQQSRHLFETMTKKPWKIRAIK